MTPDLLSVGVRALALVALFQAAGVGFFLALFGQELTGSRHAIERLGLIGAAAGLILALVHIALDATRMAGGFEGLWDADLQRLAWTSTSGVAQITQAMGLLILGLALSRPGRSAPAWASLGGVISLGGFLLTGHTSAHALRGLLAPLLALHLLVVAFWFGALAPLAWVSHIEPRPIALRVLSRFSAISAGLVPLILLAGLTMAWILAGNLAVLRKPYGELLIAKLTGFTLLIALAAYNKWRLTPALAAGGDGISLRGSIAFEYALMIAVLAVTAVMTTFFSPE